MTIGTISTHKPRDVHLLNPDVRSERRVKHLDRLEPEGLDSVEQPAPRLSVRRSPPE